MLAAAPLALAAASATIKYAESTLSHKNVVTDVPQGPNEGELENDGCFLGCQIGELIRSDMNYIPTITENICDNYIPDDGSPVQQPGIPSYDGENTVEELIVLLSTGIPVLDNNRMQILRNKRMIDILCSYGCSNPAWTTLTASYAAELLKKSGFAVTLDDVSAAYDTRIILELRQYGHCSGFVHDKDLIMASAARILAL